MQASGFGALRLQLAEPRAAEPPASPRAIHILALNNLFRDDEEPIAESDPVIEQPRSPVIDRVLSMLSGPITGHEYIGLSTLARPSSWLGSPIDVVELWLERTESATTVRIHAITLEWDVHITGNQAGP
jgi:hypothetical protein